MCSNEVNKNVTSSEPTLEEELVEGLKAIDFAELEKALVKFGLME